MSASLGLAVAGVAGAADAPDASLVRESEWQTPEKQAQSFTLPPGFRIELFAAEPMINKPINMAFDARGRLWVSSNTEYPFPAAKDRWEDAQGTRVRDSRDAIKILEDTNGDGRADTVTDFADGLNIPIGVLPYKDGCIAWSIPNIWYFADTDGDGRCDQRKILFGPLGYEKDTHGNIASLRLAPDGWVYATHGFNNVSRLEVRPENRRTPVDPNAPRKPTPSYQTANLPREQLDWGNSLEIQSGNVFRFKPDGSAVEIWSWGQVNPFGLTWDSWGNLYSADCHSNPLTQLIRGAAYPSFGRPDLGLGFGPVLCEHSHGSTGICGPLYLDGGVWGAEWDNHMLVCNPVTSRINHDNIEFTGATPRAVEQPDFLRTSDLWFRPVDMQLGPDGALYIADFYNKIIGHYEVELKHPGRDRTSGRIWRVVKDGVTNDRRTPTESQRFAQAVRFGELPGGTDPAGLPAPTARLLTERWFGGAANEVPMASVRKLQAHTDPADATLRHALDLALRHGLTAPGGFAGQPVEGPDAIALRTLARTIPTAEAAGWLLKHLRKTDAGGADLVASLTSLARYLPATDVAQLVTLVQARFAEDDATQADLVQAVTNGLAERGVSPDTTVLGWAQAVANRRLSALGASATPDWEPRPNDLKPGLPASAQPWGVQKRACADGAEMVALTSLPQPGGDWEKRTGVLRSKAFPLPPALSFWVCGHRGAPDQPAGDGNHVRLVDAASGTELARAYPPRNDTAQHVRWSAAEVSPDQPAGRSVRLEIVDGETGDAYAWLAVGRIEPAVVGVESFMSQGRARAQLAALAGLLQHAAPRDLREKLAVFLPPPPPAPPSVITPEQREELDTLIRQRLAAFQAATPDVTRGRLVFATHCASCHAIGGQGALVGPQLEGVGTRGAARLIEDIVDPNRNLDSNFYVRLITRKDGTVVAGLERGSLGEVLLCVDATGKEQRIPKSEIANNELTGLSLMPAAFGHSIPEADFNDLIGFLLGHGGGKAP
jgi:putative membrane-bound dehydrogenase-like protein